MMIPTTTTIDRRQETQAGAPSPAPGAGPARLLVVDDEESVALTVGEVLRQDGFAVQTASSGGEAVRLLAGADFDLVLTDMHMEGGDGLSVLAEIQRVAPLTIAIVLTGFASAESAIASLRHGAYDYLIKPCSIEDLKHRVRRGVEHRRLMLAEQEARHELEQLNRELEHRVRERTAELTRLNGELADANRAKDIFLATLSHELRTPLTPILGWVNLLRGGKMSPQAQAQALDTIERNARLQARLVDDLLDVSRIITGKLRFERVPVDLNAAVEAAAETVRPAAAAQRVELEVTLSAEPLIVAGEPTRLQQIVWNLVSNAVKFTGAGGRVSVRTEGTGGEARCVVEDTGVGIAPEFLPHVFDHFRQADGSSTRQHGGLGLGLAIVSALVKLHEGRVEAESEGDGRGARFTLTLPRADAARGNGEVEAYAAAGKSEERSCTVLLTEDSPDTLALLRALFTQKNCRVIAAGDAAEALRLAAQERPDIIISDIGMPGMNGYEFISRVRSLPGLKDVPAIALSGYAMEEDRRRALEAGYAAHMAKPVDLEELYARVQELTS